MDHHVNPFCCFHCFYNTEFKFNLRRHIERNHIKQRNEDRKSLSCTMCKFKAATRPQLNGHYSKLHDVDCRAQLIEFENMDSFDEWKSRVEANDRSRYVKFRGARRTKNAIYQTYVCHRNGVFMKKKGMRHLKRLGSNKINGCCPSEINITINLRSGTVSIKFIQTHVGHSMDLGRVPLSKSDRNIIAQKLSAGISSETIIGNIRNSVPQNNEERLHLVTRQDVANVARDFGINSLVVRHSSDVASVDSWVRVTQESSNTVRFYKPQGRTLPEYPALADSDFILILANDYQVQMLADHGSNIICFDGPHGTNSYDFELTTLLTVDELHKGFPCFFMFSNRGDASIIALLAQVVKDALGHELLAATLMSDMTEVYVNGWCSVMPTPTRRLYCSWHVLKAWRKHLNKIKAADKRTHVFKKLKVLQEEADEDAFYIFLNAAIVELRTDPETEEFGKYFSTEYGNCSSYWAYCHRKHCGISTNMFQSLRKTLKHIYLGGKKAKRLDKAIHGLMDFTRDKVFDKWIALHKGGDSTKLRSIRKKHDSAVAMSHDCIVLQSPNGWSVKSANAADYYNIEVNTESCNCPLRCEECECCIHRFRCTCKDSTSKWNMCKHIHLAILQNQMPLIPEIPNLNMNNSDIEPTLQICGEESTKNDREAKLLNQISIQATKDASFEKKLREMDDLFQRIRNGVKQSSDIDIVMCHMRPILPTIHAANDSSKEFSGALHAENEKVNPNKKNHPSEKILLNKDEAKKRKKKHFQQAIFK